MDLYLANRCIEVDASSMREMGCSDEQITQQALSELMHDHFLIQGHVDSGKVNSAQASHLSELMRTRHRLHWGVFTDICWEMF